MPGTLSKPIQAALSSHTFVYALSALLVAVSVVFVLVYLRRKAVKQGNYILLLGPSDAGKTSILALLTWGIYMPTHTSMLVNETEIHKPHPYKLIDVPGHPRIRTQFSEYLNKAKAIIFVVDSSTISRNGPAVAEHLHTILHAISQLPPSAYVPPVVIHAHKSDLITLPSAASSTPGARNELAATRVRTILERELEKRHQSSLVGVGVGALGEEDPSAGAEGVSGGLECTGKGPFAFERWEGGEISCIGGCVAPGIASKQESNFPAEKPPYDGLEELVRWLAGL